MSVARRSLQIVAFVATLVVGVASMAAYSIGMPSWLPKAAWMRGDSECTTGWPNTA